ncbi:hypothetical protein OUZ56_028876 [Daphnia magna]|uniref:Uncharacterized protein n=1 Tax=Daphnia magna TaxID=35525 RepID=A0ABR0B5A0_9CRUS|nr:hypothetical protein OUZ56_028876 [Daphnia magna]
MADETSSASSAFSPLSGGYLLIVLSEPHSEQHKQVLLEHLAKVHSPVVKKRDQGKRARSCAPELFGFAKI